MGFFPSKQGLFFIFLLLLIDKMTSVQLLPVPSRLMDLKFDLESWPINLDHPWFRPLHKAQKE